MAFSYFSFQLWYVALDIFVDQHYYTIAHSVPRRSERKVGIIPDRFYAFVNCQIRIYLYPLPGISHEREVKTPVPGILHSRKFCLEARLYWIGASHAIFGTEVERLVVPLAID